MKKIALTILAGASVLMLGLATVPQSADAGKACARTSFKTDLIKKACKKDQSAAKKAMKGFLKQAKKAEKGLKCNSCHSKLGPKYPLTKDGLEKYNKLLKKVDVKKIKY